MARLMKRKLKDAPREGRRGPYTRRGIRQVRCFRCTNQAGQQWTICSMDNRYFPVCNECDILLNAFVLGWMRIPDQVQRMTRYRKKLRKEQDAAD